MANVVDQQLCEKNFNLSKMPFLKEAIGWQTKIFVCKKLTPEILALTEKRLG